MTRNKFFLFLSFTTADVKHMDPITLVEQRFGYSEIEEPVEGWLINMRTVVKNDFSALRLYFLTDKGQNMYCTYVFNPYFLVLFQDDKSLEVEEYLLRTFKKELLSISKIFLNDLNMPNHLQGRKRQCIKLVFKNVNLMQQVRKQLLSLVRIHQATDDFDHFDYKQSEKSGEMYITDLREYDVTYYQRVCMDLDFRVGKWYSISLSAHVYSIDPLEKLIPPEPRVFAYDIETSKEPLKFPNADKDEIMMISYMVDQKGYLITNRSIVSQNISDFEYFPTIGVGGVFTIYNEPNEHNLLQKFISHILDIKPHIFTTYNGDMFDFPYVQTRCALYNLNLYELFGFQSVNDEFRSELLIHLDAYKWVKRDSYLPAGSHGLKAVTKAKLGYHPDELDPELMTPYASSNPQILAQYSVSDAVATYMLYMKYVHPFVFSLCNVIPLNPDDVLRKGSGTLCESLLMVSSYKAGVLMPNKHTEQYRKYHNNKLLFSETYTGGHVEALQAGIYRSDFQYPFKLNPNRIKSLKDELEATIKTYLINECNVSLNEVGDLASCIDTTNKRLEALLKIEKDFPLIYHLDVGAMYPNIILTNRLQPDAMVENRDCQLCDYNDENNKCKRDMTWTWRGEMYPLDKEYINSIENQLSKESFAVKDIKYIGGNPKDTAEGSRKVLYRLLPKQQQTELLKQRVVELSKKLHNRVYVSEQLDKVSTVCQRENSFYIDTVREFRDRRYDYKTSLKQWKSKLKLLNANGGDHRAIDEANKMVIIMDSLQLAHKCILNSFYGYVMRKGSRWFSMQMGGIVCYTGSLIIQGAHEIVDDIGFSLELDTDGIWCCLPRSFPDTIEVTLLNGKVIKIPYAAAILNYSVYKNFTNDQYQILNAETNEYSINKENSIFFEVDGPYKCMILPASTDKDRLLKKRYVVFNNKNEITELKGFEIKRRGELKLIKEYQSIIFAEYLKGSTLQECYDHIGATSRPFLDILTTQGAFISDDQILDLLSEFKSLSKPLKEYNNQKSTTITTAHRLVELLGIQANSGSLACQFIISKYPLDTPVANRAIPTCLFQCSALIQSQFLVKWCGKCLKLNQMLDWDYYLDRFNSVLLKLIILPCLLQKMKNPLVDVPLPKWVTQSDTKSYMDMSKWMEVSSKRKAADVANSSSTPDVPRKSELPKIRSDYLKYIKNMSNTWLCKYTRSDSAPKSRSSATITHTVLGVNTIQPGVYDIILVDSTVRMVFNRTVYSLDPISTIQSDLLTIKPVTKSIGNVKQTVFMIKCNESEYINMNVKEFLYHAQIPLLVQISELVGTSITVNSKATTIGCDDILNHDNNANINDVLSLSTAFIHCEMNATILVVGVYVNNILSTLLLDSNNNAYPNVLRFKSYDQLLATLKSMLKPARICCYTRNCSQLLLNSISNVLIPCASRSWSFASFNWFNEFTDDLNSLVGSLPDTLADIISTRIKLNVPFNSVGDPLDILYYRYLVATNQLTCSHARDSTSLHSNCASVAGNFRISNPGLYPKSSVVISIKNTFINAAWNYNNSGDGGVDEFKGFIKYYLNKNTRDYIIQHIDRWAHSTIFVNKMVLEIIEEYKIKIMHFIVNTASKIGCRVISMSNDYMILECAIDEFLLTTLRDIPIFKLIEFNVMKTYDVLLYSNELELMGIVNGELEYTMNSLYYLPKEVVPLLEPALMQYFYNVLKNNTSSATAGLTRALRMINEVHRYRSSSVLCTHSEYTVVDVLRVIQNMIRIVNEDVLMEWTMEFNVRSSELTQIGFEMDINVYCSKCSKNVNINMDTLIQHQYKDSIGDMMTCVYCNNMIEMMEIEDKMIELINRQVVKEMEIDMFCNMCQAVMMGYINDDCSCTGNYKRASTVGIKKDIIRDIAGIMKMPILASQIRRLFK
eukprot:NODE_141_length_17903_cov_0.288643.p1 type:complete len:1889 gc:universal NODE_141_length_17903_cov_0.288643:9604-3938(-)